MDLLPTINQDSGGFSWSCHEIHQRWRFHYIHAMSNSQQNTKQNLTSLHLWLLPWAVSSYTTAHLCWLFPHQQMNLPLFAGLHQPSALPLLMCSYPAALCWIHTSFSAAILKWEASQLGREIQGSPHQHQEVKHMVCFIHEESMILAPV